MATEDRPVTLVTGASSGLGRAVALRLAEAGAHVVVSSHREERARVVADQIRQAGGSASVQVADLLDREQVVALPQRIVEEHGRLDHVVSSGAGGSKEGQAFKLFTETPTEDFVGIVVAHWLNKAYLLRACLDHMVPAGYGRFVNISTDGGRVPTPHESVFGGAAAGLMMMTRVVSREVGRYGVRVNTVAVGPLADFDMVDIVTNKQEVPGAVGGKFAEKLQKRMVFPSVADDVAKMVEFLLGDGGSTVTGQTWSVNSGVSTAP
ncbi:SDR family oxidoreductase [Nocardiopsis sp. ATB16-24]|uniref:SDR family NAD(P)-dependent oxidoreductase n=1 Tax=Nocardiopsis sp. ATB16-24 TaxID=3019555 RepID=UPI002555B914|nr:SDR family oxidoreductase [Nocardiopsis sp. ATB16-24]